MSGHVEDGIRAGIGVSIKAIERAAELGNASQRDALLGVADGLRELSAGFTIGEAGV